ncbi:MAG: hypothetical protein LUG57_09010 [Oscillospiraceae bacterium]|nr:hypothetical protein [Oscillospiraceae bacterium]
MNGKTAAWICGALLTVSLSLLLPGLVLRVQDERLESTVQTVDVETVDLSLLSDLSVEELLYLSQAYESRVALEQGRQLTASSAVITAEDAVEGIYNWMLGDGSVLWDEAIQGAEPVPWLYVGQDGQSAILWEVVLGGYSSNPLELLNGYDVMRPMTVTVLVSDLSEIVVGLNIYWSDYDGAVTEAPENYAVAAASDEPYEVYYAPEVAFYLANAMGLEEYYLQEAETSAYESSLLVYLTEDMAGYTQSGGSFTVPVFLTWVSLRFNL